MIFPLVLQVIITAQMFPIEGKGLEFSVKMKGILWHCGHSILDLDRKMINRGYLLKRNFMLIIGLTCFTACLRILVVFF